MIIRRGRRPDKFTIIGNDILDCGLAADTLGVLVTLLSRPDNWSVSTVQLRRQFGKAGKPKSKDWIGRTMNELIAARFVKRLTIKDPKSHRIKGVDYIVFEEQQPTDSSSVQCGDHPISESGAEIPTAGKPEPEKPEPEKPAALTNTNPEQISPQKSPQENGCGISEDGQSKDIDPTGFEAFELTWPWGTVEGRDAARQIFEKLDDQHRRAAVAGIALYRAEATSIGQKKVHASTYLRSKLWKNVADEPSLPNEGDLVFIAVKAPLWTGCAARWRIENRKTSGPPKFEGEGGTLGWWFPAHWPETRSTPPHIHIGGGRMTAPPVAASRNPPNRYAARKGPEASDGQDGDARARHARRHRTGVSHDL